MFLEFAKAVRSRMLKDETNQSLVVLQISKLSHKCSKWRSFIDSVYMIRISHMSMKVMAVINTSIPQKTGMAPPPSSLPILMLRLL